MENITDEEIFDILDGIASDDLSKRHLNLIGKSNQYALIFKETALIHQLLLEQSLQEVSPNFNMNLLGKVAVNQTIVTEKSYVKLPLYVMLGLLICILVFSYSLINITENIHYSPKYNFNITVVSKKIFMLINGLLLLWIFDKTILKKIMQKTFG